ncbi:hypothetical protein Poly41_08280 [Novipirellula artificiosorum]|uniref:Uncharacterized protein n=1 Tax=Novipirellula artificiosorum TaxID=2528016 RepID=A0A5C6E4M0_9BACT|nr:hypothetical protein Poly41_08280 [Novipirellula artificiosorum]
MWTTEGILGLRVAVSNLNFADQLSHCIRSSYIVRFDDHLQTMVCTNST